MRRVFEGDTADEEDEDCDTWYPRAVVIAAMTATKPTTESRRILLIVFRADGGE
jgi:hypothetical protein